MKKTIATIILPLILLFTSCATDIDYKIPVHRFMDPETRGANLFQGEVSLFGQLSFQSTHKVTMTEVFTFGVFDAVVDEGQALSRTANFGAQAGLAILPRLDIHLRNNGDSPLMFVTKWQVLGEDAQKATPGFKLALWAGVGSMDEDEGSLTVTDNDNNSETYAGKIEVTPWELGLSGGHRLTDKILLYLNATYAKYPSQSTLTSSSPTITIKGNAELEALSLGAKFGDHKLACHVEIGASRVKWKNDIEIEQEIGTAAVAVSFGL